MSSRARVRLAYRRIGTTAPRWWLSCFDLSTEFHLFAAEHARREADGNADTAWIVKPAIGTHGVGHHIIRSVAQAAAILHTDRARGAGDRVAQLLVRAPLCALTREEQLCTPGQLGVPGAGRKLDLRVFVIVRSFAPELEIYRHAHFYARLCGKCV